MTWWCVARDTPWTWQWQAYPGVWVFVGGLVVAYATFARRFGPRDRTGGARPGPREALWFSLGVLAVWLAADWPIGALGAGYLASVHTVQFILFTMVAPPLLLAGAPRGALRAASAASPRFRRVAFLVSYPPLALAAFTAVLVATHLPPVVDTFKQTQLGSFAFDVAWLLAGIVLWWPTCQPLPEVRPLAYPARIGYLALAAVAMVAPAAFLTFARFPLYATYELAPRIGLLSAANDQQIAGLVMKSASGLVLITAMSILFFRWQREDASPTGATHESIA